MQLTKLLSDDDAVSPVIGVILMVAITVILAAVIASFVLGLGNQAGNVAPTANFEFNYDSGDQTVSVTHSGGDSVRGDEIIIRGEELDLAENTWADNATAAARPGQATMSGQVEGVSAVVSGDSWDVQLDTGGSPSEYILRVVWEDLDGDSSSELASDRGPNA